MVRRLGKERNTCALIGDLNGKMTQSDRGAGPYILDTMCSKGWIPFLQTGSHSRYTGAPHQDVLERRPNTHLSRSRFRPQHIGVITNTQWGIRNGRSVRTIGWASYTGCCFSCGGWSSSSQHEDTKTTPHPQAPSPPVRNRQRTSSDTKRYSWVGLGRSPYWTMTT